MFEGDRYIIELRSARQAGYVALGLSEDDKMGRDSVIECVTESGAVKAYTSMTVVANGKFDSPRTGIVRFSSFSEFPSKKFQFSAAKLNPTA